MGDAGSSPAMADKSYSVQGVVLVNQIALLSYGLHAVGW